MSFHDAISHRHQGIPPLTAGGGSNPTKSLRERGGLWLHPGGFRRWHLATCRGHMRMARKRLQVFYSGRVQGVGFRFTVKSLAQGFEVTGIIRNLPDGRVEMEVEGDEAELEAFRGAIRESGVGPLIRGEDIRWDESKNEFRGFEIVR